MQPNTSVLPNDEPEVSLDRVIRAVRDGVESDLISPEEFNKVAHAYAMLAGNVKDVWDEHRNRHPNRKSFALAVQHYDFAEVLFNLYLGRVKTVEEGLKGLYVNKIITLLDLD